jgi:hypothetical protein
LALLRFVERVSVDQRHQLSKHRCLGVDVFDALDANSQAGDLSAMSGVADVVCTVGGHPERLTTAIGIRLSKRRSC